MEDNERMDEWVRVGRREKGEIKERRERKKEERLKDRRNERREEIKETVTSKL